MRIKDAVRDTPPVRDIPLDEKTKKHIKEQDTGKKKARSERMTEHINLRLDKQCIGRENIWRSAKTWIVRLW